MKQWNSNGGTVWGHSGTVRWNSVVEQWNSHGGTVWLAPTVVGLWCMSSYHGG